MLQLDDDNNTLQDGVKVTPENINQWDWNLLPEVLRAYGRNTANLNKIGDKMLGTALIASACAAVGRNAHITPNKRNPTWKERCNLWGVTTAPAGSRKSEALKRAMGPYFAVQRELHDQYDRDDRDWQEERVEFESKKKRYEKSMVMMEKSGMEKEDIPPPPILRSPPTKKNIVATDMTAERIPSFIAGANGSALAMFDEMSAFFQSTGGNSSRNTGSEARSIYLSAWSGDGDDSRLRQDRTKEVVTGGMSISIFGTTQPDIIAQHVMDYKKSKDGLFSRFQLVTYEPEYHIHEETDEPFDQMAHDRYGAMIGHLLQFHRDLPFFFEDEASAVFKAWEKENERQLMKYNNRRDYLMAEVMAKRTKVVCALALVIHLIEQLETDPNPTGSIPLNALQRAIKLNDFYVHESKVVIGSEERREKEEEDLSDKIGAWLTDKAHISRLEKGITATEITTDLRKKGERPSANRVIETARALGYFIKGRRIFK